MSEQVGDNWSSMAASAVAIPSQKSSTGSARRRRPDPFLEHYFKRIDPRMAASFTEEQRRAIRSMFDGRVAARQHAVDIRRGLGFGRNRFYLVLLLGRERRLLPQSAGGAFAHFAHLFGYFALTSGLLAALATFVYHMKG